MNKKEAVSTIESGTYEDEFCARCLKLDEACQCYASCDDVQEVK